MGSDMAMEVRDFRARPAQARWEGDDLVIEVDHPISGYLEWYRGPVTESNEFFIRKQIREIPEKPAPVPSPKEAVIRVLHRCVRHKGVWSLSDVNEITKAFRDAGYEGPE